MKRLTALLFIILVFTVIYPELGILRKQGAETGYKSMKKIHELLNRHPEYRQFMFRPSERNLLDSKTKAGSDTINVLVLKVEFIEDTTTLTTGNGKMDLRGSMDSEYEIDSTGDSVRNLYYDPPHDSLYFYRQMEALRNYYLDDSHGKLYVDFDIYPKGLDAAYTVPHEMKYYGDTINIVSGMFSLLRDGLKEAEIAGNVDFSDFDCVIIFHAGSMWQTDFLYDSPFDLPAVYISGAEFVFGEPVTVGGVEFNDGIIYSETASQDGGYAFIQGGLAHEFGHQLGLYDLYDTSGETMGMGSWALMGTGNWNMNGLVPPHHAGYNAYTRYNTKPRSGYGNYVYFNQTLDINSDTSNIKLKYLGSNEDSSFKLARVPLNAHEYFLIENRYAYMSPDTFSDDPDSNGFRVWKDGVLVKVNDYDISLPLDINTGGLAVYHIDGSIIDADSGRNMINAGPVKGIDMEEADRVQDFELNYLDIADYEKVFTGSKYDVFYKGGINDRLTPGTEPSSRANNNSQSHIWIYDISPPGTLMTFSVAFDYRLDGFPFELNTEVDVNSPVIAEIDGSRVILLQTMKGEIYAVNDRGEPAFNTTGIMSSFNSDNESYSTPAVGNITGHGNICVTSYSGDIHVLRTDTVTSRGLFPSAEGSPMRLEDAVVASPVLHDIDNDGLDEILITSEDMYFHVFEYNGSTLVENDSMKLYLGAESWSMPVVAGSMIYILAADGIVRCIDFEGSEVFRSNTADVNFTGSSPFVCDMDGDSVNDIVFIRGDGTVISVNGETGSTNFMKRIGGYPFYTSPAAGDINNDGRSEIVFFFENMLYALDAKGNTLNGYPIEITDSTDIQSSPIITDINDDSKADILYQRPDGRLDAISEGALPGFPLSTEHTSNSTPAVGYLNDNDRIDIVAAAENRIYVYELNSSLSDMWNTFHISPGNNRYYKHSSRVYANNDMIVEGANNYIYPNPAFDRAVLRFESGTSGDVRIGIFDQTGTVKKEMDIDEGYSPGINEIEIDIEDLAAGFYILRLQLDSGNDSQFKFFKFVVRQ
ncbi:MAG: FG-GAP-like repeat-containing protein [bacterium]